MPKTLIIIDMQPYFDNADQRTTNEVVKLVKKAKRYKWPVLLVEYELGMCEYDVDDDFNNLEDTIKEIFDTVKATDNWILVRKPQDDGSEEIIDMAIQHEIDLSTCLVCGVNTDACVRKTVEGLAEALPDSTFEVVAKACNTWGECSDVCVEEMENCHHNVVAA